MQLARMCLVWIKPSLGSLMVQAGQAVGLPSPQLPSPTSHLCLFQCVDNIRCNGLMMNAFEENSKVTVPQMIK